MNSREHGRLRQRRRAAWIEANRKRNHPDTEAERLIGFARMWAPFGGASEEDILVHFGLTTDRFIERLWQAIAESKGAEDEILRLASVYPQQWKSSESSPRR
ncbi:MAG: hypothetical protein EON54_17270 [Alcaligenaceae bacterium]|jgi:hypothetical protein|nr:hypothetical protein [Rhodococcus sp. IEGM 248]RYH43432.1 MAG: hypothetical protein EON54_17270 [Alcaligenaceae bacterium]